MEKRSMKLSDGDDPDARIIAILAELRYQGYWIRAAIEKYPMDSDYSRTEALNDAKQFLEEAKKIS
jgi:hypothetical protein